jgi:hypothetical protein
MGISSQKDFFFTLIIILDHHHYFSLSLSLLRQLFASTFSQLQSTQQSLSSLTGFITSKQSSRCVSQLPPLSLLQHLLPESLPLHMLNKWETREVLLEVLPEGRRADRLVDRLDKLAVLLADRPALLRELMPTQFVSHFLPPVV